MAGTCRDLRDGFGMLGLDKVKEMIEKEAIDTVVLAFTDAYGRFFGKRLDGDFFLASSPDYATHACNYLLTTDMDMEPGVGFAVANWFKGFGDLEMIPDLRTLRRAAWLEKTVIAQCDVFDHERRMISVAPRSVLRKQVEAAAAWEGGFRCMAATELEYYLFRTSFRDAWAANYNIRSLDLVGWQIEDYHILQGTREEPFNAEARKMLKLSGVPVENSKGEAGIGQHELNVVYSDALTMADRHCIFKQCLKEIAEKQGTSITFMAKWNERSAGSSCHLHMNLVISEEKAQNAFVGDKTLGPVTGCSDLFRWFLGGWIEHCREVFPFYAPTINSYKRYVSASWAPTRIAWSVDNRTAGFRVVGNGTKGLRIECRLPGADCNPYLGLAAALASGLDGIRQKIEPPPCFDGDVYAAQELKIVPQTLGEAADIMDKSAFARRVFGDDVVDHYVRFYRVEVHEFNRVVSDWERRRYFEQI